MDRLWLRPFIFCLEHVRTMATSGYNINKSHNYLGMPLTTSFYLLYLGTPFITSFYLLALERLLLRPLILSYFGTPFITFFYFIFERLLLRPFIFSWNAFYYVFLCYVILYWNAFYYVFLSFGHGTPSITSFYLIVLERLSLRPFILVAPSDTNFLNLGRVKCKTLFRF